MKKLAQIIVILFVAVLGNVFFINFTPVKLGDVGNKGLKDLTPEESKKIHKIKIKKVKGNHVALYRSNKERSQRGLSPLPDSSIDGSEFEVDKSASSVANPMNGAVAPGSSTSIAPLSGSVVPAQVDNSTLAAFPAIGNQSSQGSCVAWATTYYQMSHEVCLVTPGCDNKTTQAKVFSPRWTYNLINFGQNAGAYFSDAYLLTEKHGAALYSEFPYVVSDYKSWDLKENDWKNAINHRMSPVAAIMINSDAGIANLKQLLANGHIAVIGTFINSWQVSTVKANPNSASNPFVGQSIVNYQNGYVGGHAMTVVGYDDNIWSDINGNGAVEPGELGAFKIANSWGTAWGNAGFVWAAYDAFKITSSIPGFYPVGRTELTQSGYAYTRVYTPYQPRLLGKVRLSHLSRDQMSFQLASSSISVSSPQLYWSPFALSNSGGPFAFDGSSSEIEGTFYFDLTELQTTTVDQQLFYLISNDRAAGSPLSVKGFEIVDPTVGNTLYAASKVPAFVDASNLQLVSATLPAPVPVPPPAPAPTPTPVPVVDTIAPTIPTGLKAGLTSAKVNRKIIVTVNLSWLASTDNVGVAKYMIFRNGVKLGESTVLKYSDASTATGTFTYQVKAVDAAGNQSALSAGLKVRK